ncbi:PAS domain S-box [Candidatus Methanoperedens nitroreducens]|uniref:histidine kinase n=1 Tax=Candidatus Methanoperedens nitratireducens TaxID=1392998 RepID=A0A062UWT7_9EURY|nr:ATP-binding protein [Candidatus Methanoperedens nitroreducens]KCZ71446.1 PAS domain S-box [Candidatus Methanoperedens nitroreducens]MDJ1421074.1 ATP-binding protein [Candidatus Methanoperedens sp.]
MGTLLRVLIVEDSKDDALLVVRELSRGCYDPVFERVDTAEAMSEALEEKTWDVIISDYVMPHFSGLEALGLLQKSGLDLPFIIVSGKIREDVAVEAMRAGAHDYIMKDNLTRLVPAIQREMCEAEMRRERKLAEETLRRAYDELELRVKERTAELAKVNEALQAEIQGHKRAEEALYRREQEFSALAENAPDIIARFDKKLRHIYVNQVIERITGIPCNSFIGKTNRELGMPENLVTLWDNALQTVFKTGKEKIIEFDFTTAGGKAYFESHIVPEFAKDGSIESVLGISRDITERRRTEELSKKLNDINFIINSTLDFNEIMQKTVVEAAKATGSDACNITLCKNGHWVVEYAYGLPQEVIGVIFSGEQAAISDIIENTKKPIVIKDLLGDERFRHWLLKEYGVRSVLGIPLLMRDEVIGILYFTYLSVKPTFSRPEIDFAEKLSASVSLAIQNANLFESVQREITEHRHAEEELKQRTEELARLNAELEQFAYIAAHDLQEPLRMISIFTQLLERRYKGRLDKDADEFIAYIVNGAKQMQQMIEDLLEYSQIGTRGKPFEPADLEAVFEQAIANLKVAIEENGAVVTHDPLPTVLADASQMVELLQHLISNAIKFRKEEPPRIHISAEKKGNEWVFSVQDNSIGISPEFMGQLFKIFQREHVAKYPGTGVGLAICRRIVERHGGRIWAESEPGKGSTFYFTIPEREKSGVIL